MFGLEGIELGLCDAGSADVDCDVCVPGGVSPLRMASTAEDQVRQELCLALQSVSSSTP